MNKKVWTPKKKKVTEEEKINVPFVKCTFCGNIATKGLHRVDMKIVKPGKFLKQGGKTIKIPPRAQMVHYYMCTNCVKKGVAWPKKL